jgi:hypothetical protein
MYSKKIKTSGSRSSHKSKPGGHIESMRSVEALHYPGDLKNLGGVSQEQGSFDEDYDELYGSRDMGNLGDIMGEFSSGGEYVDFDEMRSRSRIRWLHDSPYLAFFGTDIGAFKKFEDGLEIITSTRTGSALIDCIDAVARLKQETLDVHLNTTQLGVIPHDPQDAANGKGTGSILFCDFTVAEEYYEASEAEKPDVGAAALFHELIHAYHNLTGERIRIVPTDQFKERWPELMHEEARTVGLGRFMNEELSENTFRAEIGLPRRTKYASHGATIYDDDTASLGVQTQRLFP